MVAAGKESEIYVLKLGMPTPRRVVRTDKRRQGKGKQASSNDDDGEGRKRRRQSDTPDRNIVEIV